MSGVPLDFGRSLLAFPRSAATRPVVERFGSRGNSHPVVRKCRPRRCSPAWPSVTKRPLIGLSSPERAETAVNFGSHLIVREELLPLLISTQTSAVEVTNCAPARGSRPSETTGGTMPDSSPNPGFERTRCQHGLSPCTVLLQSPSAFARVHAARRIPPPLADPCDYPQETGARERDERRKITESTGTPASMNTAPQQIAHAPPRSSSRRRALGPSPARPRVGGRPSAARHT